MKYLPLCGRAFGKTLLVRLVFTEISRKLFKTLLVRCFPQLLYLGCDFLVVRFSFEFEGGGREGWRVSRDSVGTDTCSDTVQDGGHRYMDSVGRRKMHARRHQ